MMKIDNLDIDILNMVLTLISIIATIISICQAIRAKKYKEQVKGVLSTVNIMEISRDFGKIAKEFIANTRPDEWYKGKDSQYIINPLIEILIKLPSIYDLVGETSLIKNKVNDLNKNLVGYETASKTSKKNTNELIFEIQEILQNTTNTQLNKL